MSQFNSLKSGVNTPPQTRNSQKVQTSIASKIQKLQFMDEKAEKLARYFFSKKFLGEKKNFFRKRQQAALKALIHHLNAGGSGGMIKLPTGTGKTFLFGNIIKALSIPSIVLVPRENLVDGTYDEFVGNAKKSGLDFDTSQVYRIYGKEKGNTSLQAQKILQNGEFFGTLIITYQSFVKLCESDPIFFEQLLKNTGCFISDEAHRSLGDKTTQALSKAKEFIDNSNNENEEIDDEILDETILDKIDGMLGEDGYSKDDETKAESIIDELLQKSNIVHIHTTATPQLALKKLQEEIVYASTFGEVVMDGDLILPKQLSLGTAKTEVNGEKITEKENKKGLDKFYFEDGMAVYEELTLQYMDQKVKNGGYLPTVAFCNTTEQVEFYVQYLLTEGVKAIQCTTNTKGTNYCDISTAESKLENGEADVIVTCSKVGEGWDLPTLRGAMWLVPSLSPARVMQGTGRITRILNESDIERLMTLTGLSREYIQKTHQNTIVFSPNKWTYTKASNPDSEGEVPGEDEEKETGEPKNSEQSGIPIGDIFTGLELYGKYGELSLEQIQALGLDIEGLKMFLTQDELFQVLWNYEGRSEQESYDYFMGLTQKGIKNLEIGGNKIVSLLTLSGIQIKGNIKTPSGFQEWIGKVFAGKNIVKQVLLTKNLLFQTLWNYEGRSEQESYDYFMGLSQKGIFDLEIGGNKILSLLKLSGIIIDGNISTLSGFQEWIEKVFAGKKVVKQVILTKEFLFQTLWNYEGKSEQESYDYFMGLSQKGIFDLEIGGNKIVSLLTLSGIKINGNIQTPSGFQEWIEKVFAGKNIVKQVILTKELLFQTLWNYEGRSEQQSYDYFMKLSQKGIKDLEIGRIKVGSLLKLSGIQIELKVHTQSGFKEWIGKIFEGKKIIKQVINRKDLFNVLWNYEGRTEQESYDYFMGLTVKGINDLEIGGKKVKSLLTLSGIQIQGEMQIQSGFHEWIEKVFEGKNIIKQVINRKDLFETLWNYEGRSEQESYDYFMGLTVKGIKDLEIGGKKVKSLLTLSGIQIQGNIQSSSGFQEWIEKMFEGKV